MGQSTNRVERKGLSISYWRGTAWRMTQLAKQGYYSNRTCRSQAKKSIFFCFLLRSPPAGIKQLPESKQLSHSKSADDDATKNPKLSIGKELRRNQGSEGPELSRRQLAQTDSGCPTVGCAFKNRANAASHLGNVMPSSAAATFPRAEKHGGDDGRLNSFKVIASTGTCSRLTKARMAHASSYREQMPSLAR
jgi:hypothetical protein